MAGEKLFCSDKTRYGKNKKQKWDGEIKIKLYSFTGGTVLKINP